LAKEKRRREEGYKGDHRFGIEEKINPIALYFLRVSISIAFLFFNLAGVIALYFFSF
jgi:hypothetical protein